jgi:hypothetical protein
MGTIAERYQSSGEFCVDFVCLEEPCSPQEADVEVADGALPADGAFAIGILDLGDLEIILAIHGHTYMIRVP